MKPTTLLAAAGDHGVKDELLAGQEVGGGTYKMHLGGYDLGPASPRRGRVADR